MIFGCQSSIIHTSVDIHIDIQAGMFMQGHSAMDIRKNKYSWIDTLVFMDISLQFSMLLWISICISLYFYRYPCIDLLWILDSGFDRPLLRTVYADSRSMLRVLLSSPNRLSERRVNAVLVAVGAGRRQARIFYLCRTNGPPPRKPRPRAAAAPLHALGESAFSHPPTHRAPRL